MYYHRVCKAYDFMISDALVAADPVLNMSEEYLTYSHSHRLAPHTQHPAHTYRHTGTRAHIHSLIESSEKISKTY